jgi:p-aminobenzoyl-glutamate transporter AbgT
MQVLYLSVLRYIFLPLYSKWWVKETSPRLFVILLLLYFLQMINWAIYSLHQKTASNHKDVVDDDEEENSIDLCELLIPMGLSLLLSFIHSQIVATSAITSRSSNKRRHKVHVNKQGSEKVRRKKKVFR